MLEFAALTVLTLLVWGVVALAFALLRGLVWLLVLPLVAIARLIGAVFTGIIGPVLALVACAALLAGAAAIAVPLMPILFAAFVVWVLGRLSRGAASPTRA